MLACNRLGADGAIEAGVIHRQAGTDQRAVDAPVGVWLAVASVQPGPPVLSTVRAALVIHFQDRLHGVELGREAYLHS